MIPRHPGARGEAQNSQGWSTGRTGVSHAVRGSKRAWFFSSGIDLPLAARVRRRRIWYWWIARARSYKGCIQASLDSPPLRRYGAQNWIGDSRINSGDRVVSCEKKKKIGLRHWVSTVIQILGGFGIFLAKKLFKSSKFSDGIFFTWPLLSHFVKVLE